MADLQNEPPIQLHPDVDKVQTTAFINDNFRKISDAVNTYITNSTLNIASTGEGTITAPAAGNEAHVDIPHTLGSNATFIGYGYPPDTSQFYGAGYKSHMPVYYYAVATGKYVIDSFMDGQITSTNLRIFVARSTGSAVGAAGTWTYGYYLLTPST